MLLHNNYFYYKNALTPEQCQRILDKGKSVLPMDAKTLDQKEKVCTKTIQEIVQLHG